MAQNLTGMMEYQCGSATYLASAIEVLVSREFPGFGGFRNATWPMPLHRGRIPALRRPNDDPTACDRRHNSCRADAGRRLNPFPGEVDDAHAAATEFFYQFVPGWGQADLRPQAFRDHRRADLEFRPLDRFARGARRFGRRRRH